MTPEDKIDIVDFTCFLLLFVLAWYWWCISGGAKSARLCWLFVVYIIMDSQELGRKYWSVKLNHSLLTYVVISSSYSLSLSYRDIQSTIELQNYSRRQMRHCCPLGWLGVNWTKEFTRLWQLLHRLSIIFSSNDYSHLSLRVCCQLVVKVCTHTLTDEFFSLHKHYRQKDTKHLCNCSYLVSFFTSHCNGLLLMT